LYVCQPMRPGCIYFLGVCCFSSQKDRERATHDTRVIELLHGMFRLPLHVEVVSSISWRESSRSGGEDRLRGTKLGQTFFRHEDETDREIYSQSAKQQQKRNPETPPPTLDHDHVNC
jgi:hypothetical protein